ncbi:putative Methyltransferase domain-containing protein [Seiridium unicorne]|uniref:Methyltransferase domain-containing protein n=1 Tax=Seiridium unicorne TaxID=138068 RepID=A0ABR2VEH5_9PEZI
MTATMDVFMKKTKSENDNVPEQARLEDQHDTIMHSLGGKALYAPVDLSKSGLKILDSACANGRWIKDLQASSPGDHQYVGTDVVDSLYPNPPPVGTSFQNQSIKEPFPDPWQGKFDVVHQRLVMAAAAPEKTPVEVVKNLAGLLRPGGWLQMVEVVTTPVISNTPAVNQYIDMLDTLYANLYGHSDLNKSNLWGDLPKNMEEAGLKNVSKEEILVGYGAAVQDSPVREKSLRTAVAGVPNFLAVLRAMPQDVWKEEWSDLHARLHQELAEGGGHVKYIVCWGQK